MQQLIEVIKLIADKYIEHVNLIITKDNLTLEYFIFREEERDLYKTLEIEEFEDKLKVVFFPERITRLTNLKEIEDIIETLEKQSKVKTFSKTEVDYIKQKYPVGTKVKLIKMYDLINAVPTGTEGTIERIDDIGTLHIKWNNGSELGLVIGTDEFEVIGEDKICANCGKAIIGYPAIMKVYEIEIEEILQKVVKVKADSLEEAIDKVEERYRKEQYVLDYNDFKGVEFREFKDE